MAKKIRVSQPTVTRRRAALERQLIDGYTTMLNWEKLGYEIFAITLAKLKQAIVTEDSFESVRSRGLKWLGNQPNVIMSSGCRGSNADAFMISIHKAYLEYDEFLCCLIREMGDLLDGHQSVIVNLAGEEVLKPLSLRHLVETL